jgi:RNA polymerase sigma factor (TIGR02999 family)
MTPSPQEVTQLLQEYSQGDKQALDSLMPLVYQELHRLAVRYLRRESAGHTLQATALINEAYLRLVDQRHVDWHNRAQFYGIAAQLMHRILVDHARGRLAAKRGGAAQKVTLSDAQKLTGMEDLDLIALDDALKGLEAIDPQNSRIVQLRFFGGLGIEETAEVMGVSPATIKRGWNLARAWLFREMRKV